MEQHLAQQIAALKEENRELREELHREQLQSQSRVEEELSSTVINLIAAVAAVADDVDVLGSPVAQRKRTSPAAAAAAASDAPSSTMRRGTYFGTYTADEAARKRALGRTNSTNAGDGGVFEDARVRPSDCGGGGNSGSVGDALLVTVEDEAAEAEEGTDLQLLVCVHGATGLGFADTSTNELTTSAVRCIVECAGRTATTQAAAMQSNLSDAKFGESFLFAVDAIATTADRALRISIVSHDQNSSSIDNAVGSASGMEWALEGDVTISFPEHPAVNVPWTRNFALQRGSSSGALKLTITWLSVARLRCTSAKLQQLEDTAAGGAPAAHARTLASTVAVAVAAASGVDEQVRLLLRVVAGLQRELVVARGGTPTRANATDATRLLRHIAALLRQRGIATAASLDASSSNSSSAEMEVEVAQLRSRLEMKKVQLNACLNTITQQEGELVELRAALTARAAGVGSVGSAGSVALASARPPPRVSAVRTARIVAPVREEEKEEEGMASATAGAEQTQRRRSRQAARAATVFSPQNRQRGAVVRPNGASRRGGTRKRNRNRNNRGQQPSHSTVDRRERARAYERTREARMQQYRVKEVGGTEEMQVASTIRYVPPPPPPPPPPLSQQHDHHQQQHSDSQHHLEHVQYARSLAQPQPQVHVNRHGSIDITGGAPSMDTEEAMRVVHAMRDRIASLRSELSGGAIPPTPL